MLNSGFHIYHYIIDDAFPPKFMLKFECPTCQPDPTQPYLPARPRENTSGRVKPWITLQSCATSNHFLNYIAKKMTYQFKNDNLSIQNHSSFVVVDLA